MAAADNAWHKILLLRMSSQKEAQVTTYTLELSDGSDCWAVTRRYSELRRCHNQLLELYVPEDLPAFPPKELIFQKWFGKEETRTEFEQHRENELHAYFEGLLASGGISRSPPLSELLQILPASTGHGAGSAMSSRAALPVDREEQTVGSFSGFRVRLTGQPGGLEVIVRADARVEAALQPRLVRLVLRELPSEEHWRLPDEPPPDSATVVRPPIAPIERVLELPEGEELVDTEACQRFDLPPGTFWEVSARGVTASGAVGNPVSLRVRAPVDSEIPSLPASAREAAAKPRSFLGSLAQTPVKSEAGRLDDDQDSKIQRHRMDAGQVASEAAADPRGQDGALRPHEAAQKAEQEWFMEAETRAEEETLAALSSRGFLTAEEERTAAEAARRLEEVAQKAEEKADEEAFFADLELEVKQLADSREKIETAPTKAANGDERSSSEGRAEGTGTTNEEQAESKTNGNLLNSPIALEEATASEEAESRVPESCAAEARPATERDTVSEAVAVQSNGLELEVENSSADSTEQAETAPTQAADCDRKSPAEGHSECAGGTVEERANTVESDTALPETTPSEMADPIVAEGFASEANALTERDDASTGIPEQSDGLRGEDDRPRFLSGPASCPAAAVPDANSDRPRFLSEIRRNVHGSEARKVVTVSYRGHAAATYVAAAAEKQQMAAEKAPHRLEAVDGAKRSVSVKIDVVGAAPPPKDISLSTSSGKDLDKSRREQEILQLQQDARRVAQWISDVTRNSSNALMAAATGEESLPVALQTGEALCDVINAIWPGRISGILRGDGLEKTFRRVENIMKFCVACRDLGVDKQSLMAPAELASGKESLPNVLRCLFALSALLPEPPEFEGPRLGDDVALPLRSRNGSETDALSEASLIVANGDRASCRQVSEEALQGQTSDLQADDAL